MNKRLPKLIAATLIASTTLSPICSAGIFDSLKGMNTSQIISSFGGIMGGLPCGKNATYSWQSAANAATQQDGDQKSVDSYVVCQTSGGAELNEEVSASCFIYLQDKKHFRAQVPMATASDTFESTGIQELTMSFPIYQIAEERPDPKNKGKMIEVDLTKDSYGGFGRPVGQVIATVSVDVYGGKNNLGDESTPISYAVDPTYEDPTANLPLGVQANVETDGGPTSYDPSNAGLNNPIDHSGSLPGDSSLTDATLGNGNGYGDYINNALGDLADAFNSGDDDWLDGDGGNSGESSLDDYFNGIENDEMDVPGGLTDDILGVGEDIYGEDEETLAEGQYAEADTGEGEQDAEEEQGGFVVAEAGNDEAVANSDGYGFGDLASVYERGLGGLDGSGMNPNGDGSNSGLLGGITGSDSSSLSKRLRQLAGGDPSVVNNPTATASEQELFDIAKNSLLAKGINIEDMRKGTNYAPNSAWTDPALAWDFNRITTLLRRHKISLAGGKK